MFKLGKIKTTHRGFPYIDFLDRYNVSCSLQMSSLAENPRPGTSAVWLGCDDADPRVLVPGKGWLPVIMPKIYAADTRMHLDRKQVAGLIYHLIKWLLTGKF